MDEQQGTIEQSQGGGFNPSEAAAANRASLERAYDAIQSRERAEATRSAVIHDEARAKAVAERKAEEADYRAQGLPVYQGGAPATIRDSMSAAFDRAEAKQKAAEARRMPPLKEGTTLHEQLEAGYDWRELSAADQRLFRGGHDAMAEQRKAAEWFGLSLEEAKVASIEKKLEERDRVTPLLDRFAKLAPNQSPEATLQWHADVAESFRRNPQAAYDWLGEQLGVQQHVQQAQQFAQAQHQQRQAFEAHARAAAAAARQQALQGAVLSSIDDFARARPDFARLEGAMVDALNSGRIRRTGRAAVDLANAYRHVGGSYA